MGFDAQAGQQPIEQPGLAVDGDDAEDAHQRRQDQRQAEQPQQQRSPGKSRPPRQRPRHQNGRPDAKQGRQQRLPNREGDDPPRVRALQEPPVVDRPGGAHQTRERAADDEAEQEKGKRPRNEPLDH